MFSKIKFPLIFALIALIAVFSVSAADEILPDSEGKYSYTYVTDKPNTSFVVMVVEGLLDEEEIPDLEQETVLYYNIFKSDNDGNLDISFIPASYKDATVYTSALGRTAEFVCYIKAGEALDIADFTINLTKTDYTVNGTDDVYVRLGLEAVDSFGFPAEISGVSMEIADYTGNDFTYIPDAKQICIAPKAKTGTYTANITMAGITKQATFTVSRTPSVAKEIKYNVNGVTMTSYYIDCVHKVSSCEFDPASRTINAVILDQFGDETDIPLTFTYNKKDSDNSVTLGNGNSAVFTPPAVIPYNELVRYDLRIFSSEDPTLTQKIYMYVEGVTNYTGNALTLYDAILLARSYIAQTEDGTINISTDGKDVHYTEKWTKTESVEKLQTALDTAVLNLEKFDAGEINTNQVSSQATTLNKAISTFTRSILKGLDSPIEALSFSQSNVKATIGSYKRYAVKTTPDRPSEDVIYSSSDENVVTVAQDGTIKAISEGTATITAASPSNGAITASYTVEVYTPITSIKYASGVIDMVSGEVRTPEIRIAPAVNSDTVTYKSSDVTVATVDENGKITGISSGSALITATTVSGLSTSISVSVTAPTFSGISTMRTKPAGSFKLILDVESSKGIKDLEVKLEYDKAVFTVKTATDLELLKTYGGSDYNADEEYVSVWSVDEPHRNITGSLIEYEFTTSETAEYGKYPIKFHITAYSDTGEKISSKGTPFTAEVTVGETDTYHINATVTGDGKGTITGGGDFTYGTVITLTAEPESLYTVSTWYLNSKNLGVSTTEYELTVTADATVSVKFAKKSVNPPSGGSISAPSKDFSGVPDAVVEQVKTVTPGIISGSTVAYGSKLTLATATPGALIYYTTDGSTPSAASIPYPADGIPLTEANMYIRVIAVKGGMIGSTVADFRYTVDMSTKPPEQIVIKLKDNASSIKYLDGSSPEIRPDDAATRYEIVEMLDKLFDITGVSDTALKLTDVDEAHREMITRFVGAGIINGYPEGIFGGERSITRAELVKILSVMLGVDMTDMSIYNASFTDTAGHWAENYIKAFVTKGYIIGYPEGDFRPDNPVTRAEAVTVFNRITGIILRTNIKPVFADLTEEHWSYDTIMNIADVPVTSALAEEQPE